MLQANLTATPGTDLEIRRGDVVTLTFNTGRNLSGKIVYFTAKNDPEDDNTDAVILGTCTVATPSNGIATYTTTAVETAVKATLYYDVDERETDDSNPSTIMVVKLHIRDDVHQ